MTDKQPKALWLADVLTEEGESWWEDAAELRRLHEVNAELVEALREIAEWTDRYTTPGHPVSTVAKAAIAKATGEQQ